MNKTDVIKAAMAAAGADAKFGPAQLQKLFFLIDIEIPEKVGGPIFNFEAYDYGPFDMDVYDTASTLKVDELIDIDHSRKYRQYSLTDLGFIEGNNILNALDVDAKLFFEQAANWVRSVSFQDMVSSIYKHYPETKVNSIFK